MLETIDETLDIRDVQYRLGGHTVCTLAQAQKMKDTLLESFFRGRLLHEVPYSDWLQFQDKIYR